jgi:hypothetical protein
VDRRRVRAAVVVGIAGHGNRRIPQILVGRAEGEVAHVGCAEAPGQLPVLATRGRASRAAVSVGDDADDLAVAPRTIQARSRLGTQDLGRIRERPGAPDEPALRNGDLDVVIAVPHVELGDAEVWIALPAVHVVVNRDLGIPVRDHEDLSVRPLARRAVGGYGERPVEREIRRVAGSEGARKPDPQSRRVHQVPAGRGARELGGRQRA